MPQDTDRPTRLVIVVTPNFNIMATVGLVDPMRAVNYLDGAVHFRWVFVSAAGGMVQASNGLSIETIALADVTGDPCDIVFVSSSWAPEVHARQPVLVALRRWAAQGVTIGALDTGSLILAQAGLLRGQRATVHYEHIDSLGELYDDIEVAEGIFVTSGKRITCCGGVGAIDLGVELVRLRCGNALANAAARYIFHPIIRPEGAPQNPSATEPFGHTAPAALRQIILEMERNLEEPLTIPDLCARIGVSQRQAARLFDRYVGRSPVLYYRDIRLDRARGLVTQTDLQMSEIAAATGFVSQTHFSKAYKDRFGIAPRDDRREGRIPFEFRAWPMHHRQTAVPNRKNDQ